MLCGGMLGPNYWCESRLGTVNHFILCSRENCRVLHWGFIGTEPNRRSKPLYPGYLIMASTTFDRYIQTRFYYTLLITDLDLRRLDTIYETPRQRSHVNEEVDM